MIMSQLDVDQLVNIFSNINLYIMILHIFKNYPFDNFHKNNELPFLIK